MRRLKDTFSNYWKWSLTCQTAQDAYSHCDNKKMILTSGRIKVYNNLQQNDSDDINV